MDDSSFYKWCNTGATAEELRRAETSRQRLAEVKRQADALGFRILPICEICGREFACPGLALCQTCIDTEDRCLRIAAAVMVRAKKTAREQAEARLLHDLKHAPPPRLLDTLNVWIDAYRTPFYVACACGLAYGLFAWIWRQP